MAQQLTDSRCEIQSASLSFDERQILALDALSKLAEQFADRPDVRRLMDVFTLTLSGQFSSPSVFALIRPLDRHDRSMSYFGTGRFKSGGALADMELTQSHAEFFVDHNVALPVEKLELTGPAARCGFVMAGAGVAAVAPLVHGNQLLGIVGLGERVGGRPYTTADLELLSTMVHSTAPFIANSFLFLEIADLNAWHLGILNNVRQGVFVFDSAHKLVKINQTGYNIIKVFIKRLPGPESLHGLPFDLIFPDKVFHGWGRRLIGQGVKHDGEAIENMVANDSQAERIFTVRVSTLNREASGDRHLILTLEDITDLKANEQRMFELERFADKGVMASTIAHELNNFLSLILGGVEIALINMERGKDEKVSDTLEKLRDNVTKMERFTAGLTDYTKLNTQKAPADLNEVIADVLSFVEVHRRFTRIRLSRELQPNIPTFELDKDQIAQLLLNVLNNAADALREAGPENPRIILKTFADGEQAGFSVSDNGAGIKPEVKDRLFKAHLTTKEHGHGYGLVTCSRIIENHHGKVEIDSAPGQGATFRFTFPIVAPPPAQ